MTMQGNAAEDACYGKRLLKECLPYLKENLELMHKVEEFIEGGKVK